MMYLPLDNTRIYRYLSLSMKCFAALLMTQSAFAAACSCMMNTKDDYLNRCDQLFVATLIESTLVEKRGNRVKERGTLSPPIKVIKGDASIVKNIVNVRSGTSCDSFLSVGSDYVICASGTDIVENHMCGPTQALGSNSGQFLKQFD